MLEKSRYVESMSSIIFDCTKFEENTVSMQKYYLKIENKINNILRKLNSLKLLSDDVYKKMFVSGLGPEILYGLPKIH